MASHTRVPKQWVPTSIPSARYVRDVHYVGEGISSEKKTPPLTQNPVKNQDIEELVSVGRKKGNLASLHKSANFNLFRLEWGLAGHNALHCGRDLSKSA